MLYDQLCVLVQSIKVTCHAYLLFPQVIIPYYLHTLTLIYNYLLPLRMSKCKSLRQA